MFFGDGGQVGLVLGYLGALGEVLPDQSACVLVAASLPWAVGIGEVDRHVGGPGTGRRGRCISLPWSQVRVPFIRSGSPLTWSISASHTPAESLPLGRARIVTNRVVRPRQGDSGAAPVGADDQVALPVARHPPVGGFFGALVDADHADDRGFALAQGSARSAPGAPGAQHDPVLAQRRARHSAESRCRSPRQTRAAPIASGDPLQGPSVSSVASTRSPPGEGLPGRARARQVGQHPGPKGRAGVDHLGVLGRDLRRCAVTSAPTGRYPQALLVAGDLPRDHRDITTDPLSDPAQRPALLQPPCDRSPIRHRQHPTQHNLPPLTSTVATTL